MNWRQKFKFLGEPINHNLIYFLPVPNPSLLRQGDGGISNVVNGLPGVVLKLAPSLQNFLACGVANASSPGILNF